MEDNVTCKRKLKDLTVYEFQKWQEINCPKISCVECIFKSVACFPDRQTCWINNKGIFNNEFLNQEVEVRENYLNDKEKDYLNSIIALFKEDVLTITKRNLIHDRKYIEIVVSLGAGYKYTMNLCPFEKDTMYENMELDKEYTLEELGL